MGLFGKENCLGCNKEIGLLTKSGVVINGVHMCGDCALKIIKSEIDLNKKTGVSDQEIKKALSLGEKKINEEQAELQRKNEENAQRLSQFKPTTQIGGYIWFDDNHKWFVFPQGTFSSKIEKCYVFQYEEILDFEVLEDGTSVTKGGFGKALVGGAVFGLAGAIAGGTSKKTKQVCTKLQLKVTTRNVDRPVIYLDLINTEFKKDSFVYKQASKSVQDILSKFQIIIDQLEQEKSINDNSSVNSVADEIKKFKELLDMGAISQEEFDAKKKELLNL